MSAIYIQTWQTSSKGLGDIEQLLSVFPTELDFICGDRGRLHQGRRSDKPVHTATLNLFI